MLVGIFSDTHDHLDNLRRAVALFNERGCETVLFAGDLVSTFAVPPLRELKCPLLACFGDNEGNRVGIIGGFQILGEIKQGPAFYQLADGTRVLLAHMPSQLREADFEYDLTVYGHTHKPDVRRDQQGRLVINPGETSGWTYGQPTVAILETTSQHVEIVNLNTSTPLESWNDHRRRAKEIRKAQ